MGPSCQGKGICLHAACVSVCMYKSQFTNGISFPQAVHVCLMSDLVACVYFQRNVCDSEAVVFLKGCDVSGQAGCVMCRQPAPPESVYESVKIAWKGWLAEKSTKQRWKCGKHGELQSGEEVVWGQSQRRADKRRGVQLCKMANLTLT